MFQQSGNVFPDKGLLKSNYKGLHTVCIVDVNIVSLTLSGPMAFLIGKTAIISITSDYSITISARYSLQYKTILVRICRGLTCKKYNKNIYSTFQFCLYLKMLCCPYHYYLYDLEVVYR